MIDMTPSGRTRLAANYRVIVVSHGQVTSGEENSSTLSAERGQ